MKMNQKKLLLLALLLTVSSLVFAQGISAIGFKGGLNIANYTGDDVSNELDSKLGFTVGAFVTYKVNANVSIQPEFLVTTKGTKFEEEYNETYTYTETLTYLEIPLLLKFDLETTGTIRPNIFIGPALALNIGATAKEEYDGEEESVDLEFINPINFDIVVGVGIDTKAITFDVRYDLSLSKISDHEYAGDAFNSVISFMIGVKI